MAANNNFGNLLNDQNIEFQNNDGDLGELFFIFKRRQKFLKKIFVSVLFLTFFATIFERNFSPIYEGNFTLLISDPLQDDDALPKGGLESQIELLALNKTTNDIPTLIELLKSPLLLEPLAKKYNLELKNLNKNLSIRIGGGTGVNAADGILKISYLTKNMKKGKFVLNDLAKSYLQTALVQRQQRLSDGLRFLNEQYPAIQKKNSEIQNIILEFRKSNNLIQPDLESASIKKVLLETESEVNFLESEKQLLNTAKSQIIDGKIKSIGFQEKIGSQIASNPSLTNNGLTVKTDQSLFDQVIELESKLANARSLYKSNSDIIRNFEARLKILKPLLLKNQLEAVNSALSINESKLNIAYQRLGELNTLFLKQPTLIKEFSSLKQQLLVTEKNLDALISAKETFQLEMAQNTVPWKIIKEPKFNEYPVYPSYLNNTLIGLFLAIILSLFLTFVRDRLDYVFHDDKEVLETFNIPILSSIPYIEKFKGVRKDAKKFFQSIGENIDEVSKNEKDGYERFFYQEALRNLYTSIRFMNPEKSIDSILVTSSTPAEGKTLVNLLLAKTISEFDKRVLIIDADMRKPQIHSLLRLNNLKGLSNILSNKDVGWEECIQNPRDFANISVIPAGIIPPDPARLINSKRMKDVIKNIKDSEKFDLIIFDAPPIIGISDASLLSEFLDGIVLLISLENVKRNIPGESIKQIQKFKGNLIGMVTNATKEIYTAQRNKYYAYQYYGYGYGQKNKKEDFKINEEINGQSNKNKLTSKVKSMIISLSKSIVDWFDS